MKRLLWLCALACVAAPVAAPPLAYAAKPATPDLIEGAARGKKIDRDTATRYLAYALGRPAKLPAAYRSDTPWDGTLPLRRLREDVKKMKPGPQRIETLAVVATTNCSNSSGALPNSLETTHFQLEYGTIAGGLSASDYTDSLEEAWGTEVTSFGWAAPPRTGGVTKYPVRVDDLGPGLYGFVSNSGTGAGSVGDNPNTAWNDGDAQATCMALNEDYTGFPSPPQASLDATTAHEFNHSIQFGYGALNGANAPDQVFSEGGATWMEDEVQDASNDNYHYLWPVFRESMGDYDASPYPYWITFRGLTERYGTGVAGGGEQVMQDFWEATSQNAGNSLGAINSALVTRGTTLADAFHAYAIAVKFNKACTGGYAHPYCFEEGPGYVNVAGGNSPQRTLSSVGTSTANTSIEDNYALSWVQLPGSGGPYDVNLENRSAGGQLRGTVVCDTGSALARTSLPSVAGANSTVTLTGYNPSSTGCSSAPVLVITNQAQTGDNPSTSATRTFRASTTTGSGPPPPLVQHQLTVSRTGNGTVTSNPGGISCGGDCSQAYDEGTIVTLGAAPDPGWHFTGWGGACSGTGGCQVTMDSDLTVTASFAQDSSGGGGGGGGGGTTTNPITGPVTTSALDTLSPRLTALGLSARAFRAARAGPSVRAAASPLGTRVSWVLSEPASVRFRVERALPGRLVGGRCVRPTRANAARRRCTRYVLLAGSFTRSGRAGTNSLRFMGRLAGRALALGSYRLTATATDAAGNRSLVRRITFRVVRR